MFCCCRGTDRAERGEAKRERLKPWRKKSAGPQRQEIPETFPFFSSRIFCPPLLLSTPPHPSHIMNSQFTTALARTLPSISRQCQFRPSLLRLARPFSSTPRTYETAKQKTRETERRLFDVQTEEDSPMSTISKMLGGQETPPPVTEEYSQIAETLEAQMIPYGDKQPPHHLHVYSHKHNTILTLTRPNGNPMLVRSCGHLGFRKSQRSGYDPAYQLTTHMFGQMQEKGLLLEIQRLDIVFRDFGPGREAFTKVLLGNEGRNIRGLVSRVTDASRIKFGGTRSRKVRRLG